MLTLTAPPVFEDIEDDDEQHYLTLFEDHLEGEDVLMAPRSALIMRVGKEELPWTDIHLESKSRYS